jgi:hypothetical protein
MYEPQGLALEIFKKRYTLHPNESWTEACIRVANHVAEAENGADVIKYRSEFLDILQQNLFSPGEAFALGARPCSGGEDFGVNPFAAMIQRN